MRGPLVIFLVLALACINFTYYRVDPDIVFFTFDFVHKDEKFTNWNFLI